MQISPRMLFWASRVATTAGTEDAEAITRVRKRDWIITISVTTFDGGQNDKPKE
jgi:hypothetical protein